MCIADRAVEVSPQWNLDYVMPYTHMIIITVSCIMPYPTGQCINEYLSECTRKQRASFVSVAKDLGLDCYLSQVLRMPLPLIGECLHHIYVYTPLGRDITHT